MKTHAIVEYVPFLKMFKTACGAQLSDVGATLPLPTCSKCATYVRRVGSTPAWLSAVSLKEVAPKLASRWARIARDSATKELADLKERVETAENNLADCEKLANYLGES